MSDETQNTPFGPFPFPTGNPPSPKTEKPNGDKPPKKRGRPRKAEAAATPKKAVQPKPKRAVVAAGAPKAPRKTRAVTVDLVLAVQALTGLTTEDARFVTGVVQAMQAFPVKQRKRISAAIGALFA